MSGYKRWYTRGIEYTKYFPFPSISLSLSMSVSVSVCITHTLSLHDALPISLCLCHSLSISFSLSLSLSLSLLVCLFVTLSIYLYMYFPLLNFLYLPHIAYGYIDSKKQYQHLHYLSINTVSATLSTLYRILFTKFEE